jgi:hypothetical protein
MTIKEIIAELPKLTQAEKRELRRALDRELAFGPRGPKDAERVRTPEHRREQRSGTNF